jgi:predicted XRE-type DNA-binding protein
MSSSQRKKDSSRSHSEGTRVIRGSGNVFADLGLDDAEALLAKARLAHSICSLVEEAGLNQVQAAKRLGIDQPKVSNLMRGKLRDFSIQRLMEYLVRLGQDVEIRVRPANPRRAAAVRVEAA